MKQFAEMFFCLLFATFSCAADNRDSSSIALDGSYTMPLAPSPQPSGTGGLSLLPNEPQPLRTESLKQRPLFRPTPSPLTDPDTSAVPSSSPEPYKFVRQQSYEDFFQRDTGSKSIAGLAGLMELILWLVVFGLYLKLRIKKHRDPLKRFARTGALLMLLFKVASQAIRPELQISAVAGDIVLWFGYMMAIYVGYRMWRKLGVDYSGIGAWNTRRQRVIGISLSGTAAIVLYSELLFALTRPSSGWAIKILNSELYGSHIQKMALLWLLLINAAFAEELVYRGCFQSIFTKWFGGTPAASWAAIFVTS